MDRTLVLITGPSGAGKDTILRAASEHFEDDPRVKFIRRYINRPAGKDEDNRHLSDAEFADCVSKGAFLSHWHAHGHMYGIMKDDIINGVNIISVSRTVVKDIAENWPDTLLAEITADRETLFRRLSARGRESEEEVKKRLERYVPVELEKAVVIDNSADLTDSVRAFCEFISGLLIFYK